MKNNHNVEVYESDIKSIDCPKCGAEMAVFGITEDGLPKYHCAECYNVVIKKTKIARDKDDPLKKSDEHRGPDPFETQDEFYERIKEFSA